MKYPRLLALAAVTLTALSLSAQDAASVAKQLAGKWRIALGQNPGSTKTDYTGTVTVTAKPTGTLGLVWTVDGLPAAI